MSDTYWHGWVFLALKMGKAVRILTLCVTVRDAGPIRCLAPSNFSSDLPISILGANFMEPSWIRSELAKIYPEADLYEGVDLDQSGTLEPWEETVSGKPPPSKSCPI